MSSILTVLVEVEDVEFLLFFSEPFFGVLPLEVGGVFFEGHYLALWPFLPRHKHRSFLSKPSQLWRKGHLAARLQPLAVFPKNPRGTSPLETPLPASSVLVLVGAGEVVLCVFVVGDVGCVPFRSALAGLSLASGF